MSTTFKVNALFKKGKAGTQPKSVAKSPLAKSLKKAVKETARNTRDQGGADHAVGQPTVLINNNEGSTAQWTCVRWDKRARTGSKLDGECDVEPQRFISGRLFIVTSKRR